MPATTFQPVSIDISGATTCTLSGRNVRVTRSLFVTSGWLPAQITSPMAVLTTTCRPICMQFAHCASDEIGQSDEIRYKTCLRALIHLCWGSLLLQTARIH